MGKHHILSKVDELIILTRKVKVNENLIPRETLITWKTRKAFPLPFPGLFASRRTTCPVNPMNRLYLVLHPSRTARFLSLCQFGFQLSRKRHLLGQCRGCQPHSAEQIMDKLRRILSMMFLSALVVLRGNLLLIEDSCILRV